VTDSAFLVLIEPMAVSFGAAAAQENTVCDPGRTDADRVTPLLAVLHRSLYVAWLELCASAVSTLISAHPSPALLAVTVPPVTCRLPGVVKLNVCTGPCFPDEYSHR
jgi:hypothetical protein